MKFQIVFHVLLIAILTTSLAVAAEHDPGKSVQQTVNNVLLVLGDNELSSKEKREQTYKIIENEINFPGMSRRILALSWKSANDEQKARFTVLFKQILLNTYWERIKNFSGQRVEYITGMTEGDNFATIDTVIVSDKVEIPITYRMEVIDGKWLAYDFLVESLSLVTSYRTEYRNIIKLNGIDGLLQQMEKELAEITSD